jgi:glycosyltransferase involved in cell wall biosynthesis
MAEDEPRRAGGETQQWLSGDQGSLGSAVATLNAADIVLIQHEYGIFGGADGDEVLALARGLHAPLVVVAHTVLATPLPHQRYVIETLMNQADVVVVASAVAAKLLIATHPSVETKVVVIPHGAVPNVSGLIDDVGFPQILTWGLIGPGKGIEHGIRALGMLEQEPLAHYVIAGRTHPKVLAQQGERYRGMLQELAEELGVTGRVHFINSYQSWDQVRAETRACDVVLLPYDTREQVCSGVLVEALAAGKPVVATAFPHAEELLAEGAGILVDQGDAEAMARALAEVLYDSERAAAMSGLAREIGESLAWPRVGEMYRDVCARVLLGVERGV